MQSNSMLTNLGRYWPSEGPQFTLYTPSVFLTRNATNYVALIEFEDSKGACFRRNKSCYVEFLDHPILDGEVNLRKKRLEELRRQEVDGKISGMVDL